MLTNKEILESMESAEIIISPFNMEQLEDCSYNLAIGHHIARYRPQRQVDIHEPIPAFDPTLYDPAQLFELEYCASEISILPGERILGHTVEFAGGVVGINTHLQAKSTTQRVGLSVCLDAGFGNVGYFNRWTLEISNHSPIKLVLPVGTLVAQIIFHRVGPLLANTLYHERGNYQKTNNLDTLRQQWCPSQMLPKRMKVQYK